MSNQNSQLISDYVYLVEASYADFSGKDYTDIDLMTTAIKSAGGGKPENFAKLVTNNYSVVAHYKDRTDESSFFGTLFQNKRENLCWA